jgi:hypothetical protein
MRWGERTDFARRTNGVASAVVARDRRDGSPCANPPPHPPAIGEMTLAGKKLRYEEGLLSKAIRSVQLSKIQEVRVDQSIGQRMLGAGDISIETSGETSRLEMDNLDRPQAIADELIAASQEHGNGQARGDSGALRHVTNCLFLWGISAKRSIRSSSLAISSCFPRNDEHRAGLIECGGPEAPKGWP